MPVSRNCRRATRRGYRSTAAIAAAAAGDQLIDNFYKRGRKVKVALYANVAATGTPVVLIKRVDGMPPKFAALASFPSMAAQATATTSAAPALALANRSKQAWQQCCDYCRCASMASKASRMRRTWGFLAFSVS